MVVPEKMENVGRARNSFIETCHVTRFPSHGSLSLTPSAAACTVDKSALTHYSDSHDTASSKALRLCDPEMLMFFFSLLNDSYDDYGEQHHTARDGRHRPLRNRRPGCPLGRRLPTAMAQSCCGPGGGAADPSATELGAAERTRAAAANNDLAHYARQVAGERGHALVVLDADPALAIVRAAEQEAIDVLVVGNFGMAGRKEFYSATYRTALVTMPAAP